MPNADKSSFASRTGAMNVRPLDWGLSLIWLQRSLDRHRSLLLVQSSLCCYPLFGKHRPSIVVLQRLQCSLETRHRLNVGGRLGNLAAVLVDPTTERHRREGYSVSELQTLAGAFAHSLQARNLTIEAFYKRSFPLIAWIDPGSGGHFTLVEEATETSIALADPTRGRLAISSQAWRELWLQQTTGIVLELE